MLFLEVLHLCSSFKIITPNPKHTESLQPFWVWWDFISNESKINLFALQNNHSFTEWALPTCRAKASVSHCSTQHRKPLLATWYPRLVCSSKAAGCLEKREMTYWMSKPCQSCLSTILILIWHPVFRSLLDLIGHSYAAFSKMKSSAAHASSGQDLTEQSPQK